MELERILTQGISIELEYALIRPSEGNFGANWLQKCIPPEEPTWRRSNKVLHSSRSLERGRFEVPFYIRFGNVLCDFSIYFYILLVGCAL